MEAEDMFTFFTSLFSNLLHFLNTSLHKSMIQTILCLQGNRNHKYSPFMIALTETLNFSSSFSCFCWRCLWRAWFSSNILIRLACIWDCTRARVCMHRKVVVAWCFTDWPCIRFFSLTSPLKARNALLAWETMERSNLSLSFWQIHIAHMLLFYRLYWVASYYSCFL